MHNFAHDLRYALRQVRKTPAFSIIAVLTLALGIGANTAMFSVMSAVLLRYLPVRDPQRLVFLHYGDQPDGTSQSGYDDTSLSEPVFEALRTRHDVFSDVIGFVPLSSSELPVRFGDQPEEARGDMTSGNFFSGLGIVAALGRTFTLEHEKAQAPVVVLSYAYWSRRFARDPAVVNHVFYIKGVPFTVIGVAAPGFLGVERDRATDFWIPLTDNPELKPWGNPASDTRVSVYGAPHWFFLMMIGRLQPGVTATQALSRIQPVYQNVVSQGLELPKQGTKKSELYFTNARGIEGLRDTYKQPLRLLMWMVVTVLAIACANVSMLLVARNTLRRREFSIRMALGSNVWRLFSQLLSESLLLVLAGAALGWWFAVLATETLAHWSRLEVSLAPDRMVLLFTVCVSAVVALVFGVAPLRSAVRVPIGLALKSSVTTTQDRSRVRIGQATIALQVAFCVILLVGAALLVRTMRKLDTANLGMRTSGLVVFGVTPPASVHGDQADILFVNESEALQLSRERDVERALALLGTKAPCVVIKRGPVGALGIWNGQTAFAPGFSIHAIDTTGAGDSFAAGFVHAYLEGNDLARCLQAGNACGAMSALRVGGTTGQPTCAQLAAFLKEHGKEQTCAQSARAKS